MTACNRCGSEDLIKNGGSRLMCKVCGASAGVARHVEKAVHKRFLITSAIEEAPVKASALEACKAYCKAMNARLIVIPIKYNWSKKRKSKKMSARKPSTRFAKVLLPYLRNSQIAACPQFTVAGQINISPTAENPLSGLHGIAGPRSSVVGHPRMEFTTHPTGPQSLSKMQFTTGAITHPRYTNSKLGEKAKFHHVLGALLVEVADDGTFFPRHVCFNADGSFQDLHTLWTVDGPVAGPALESYVFGDVHAAVRDSQSFDDQCKPGGTIPLLRPKKVFLHDWFDGESISHHATKFDRMRSKAAGKDVLEGELEETARSGEVLLEALSAKAQVFVVNSNHNRWIERWLSNERAPEGLKNAKLFHAANAWMAEEIEAGHPTDVFAWFMRKLLKTPERFTFLAPSDEMKILGVDHAQHGDVFGYSRTPGARGFTKATVKMSIGHSHSPCRIQGIIQGGTCGPRNPRHMGGAYNATFDTDILLYTSGKRTHLNKINGKFRREDACSARLDKLSKAVA